MANKCLISEVFLQSFVDLTQSISPHPYCLLGFVFGTVPCYLLRYRGLPAQCLLLAGQGGQVLQQSCSSAQSVPLVQEHQAHGGGVDG